MKTSVIYYQPCGECSGCKDKSGAGGCLNMQVIYRPPSRQKPPRQVN